MPHTLRHDIAPVPAIPEEQLKIAQMFGRIIVRVTEIAFVEIPEFVAEIKAVAAVSAQSKQNDQAYPVTETPRLEINQKPSYLQSVMLSVAITRNARQASGSQTSE